MILSGFTNERCYSYYIVVSFFTVVLYVEKKIRTCLYNPRYSSRLHATCQVLQMNVVFPTTLRLMSPFLQLFFILRKKFEHVSTLHVIHHGCMPMSVWMGMKFAPGTKI